MGVSISLAQGRLVPHHSKINPGEKIEKNTEKKERVFKQEAELKNSQN